MNKVSEVIKKNAGGIVNGNGLCYYTKDQYDELAAAAKEAEKKAARLDWALPILSGDDNALANRRALELAAGIMRLEKPEDIIDRSIAAEAK